LEKQLQKKKHIFLSLFLFLTMVIKKKMLWSILDVAFEALFPEECDLSVQTPQLSPAKTVEKSPRKGKNQLAFYDGVLTDDTTEDFLTKQHRREHDKDDGSGNDRADLNGADDLRPTIIS
jgi:hypothetical protein